MVEFVITGFKVTTFTLVSQPALVRVIIGMAALSRTIFRRARVFAAWVAVFALVLFVLAFERPLGVFIMGEFQRRPGARRVAA